MTQKLSPFAQTNIHLRNEKTKYKNQKNRALKFEQLYKEEKEKNKKLEEKIKSLLQEKETDTQTIEEYQRMIFHKKTSKDTFKNEHQTEQETLHKSIFNEAKSKKRSKQSYIKPSPKKSEVKFHMIYEIDHCPDCWWELVRKNTYDKYIEDIDASFVADRAIKNITRETIESGYCNHCKSVKSHRKIPKSPVVFGENIRMFVNFQFTVLRISYSMIQSYVKIIYDIDISEGEIRNMLASEAEILRPQYEQLRNKITSQKGVHFDETGWLVQQDDSSKYSWCMTGSETEDVLYEVWISRGGWAVKLLSQNIKENEKERKARKNEEKIVEFVGISDGYGGYTNKFAQHQLCWAHPHRKLRELSESKSLEKEKLERCKNTYHSFSTLYKQLRKELKDEDKKVKNNYPSSKEKRQILKDTLQTKLEKIVEINENDPKKLITYKTTIAKYIDKYFVCILEPGIPADNNKAERALRHLVLKRKMCNGSINENSAKYMSINYSVLLSLYWKSPRQLFSTYKLMRDACLKLPVKK